MARSKTNPLALDGAPRERLVEDLRHWFQQERGETIGSLAADHLVEFFQERAAALWYDRGVQDALAIARDRMERLSDDLDLLRRSPG